MKMYVLDTSVVGFAQQQDPTYLHHLQNLPAGTPVVTTIITLGEDLGGWLPACRRAVGGEARVKAYARLQRGQEFYQRVTCLPFDDSAAAIFDQLRSQKTRIGTNDLAIAAIALSVSGVLVTSNVVDFERVPGLPIEDWTR
jgi:tRNA(fMet)-specific endonuclease VapC